MKVVRAFLFGLLGAGAMSVVSALLRAIGLPVNIELYLGTLTGMPPATDSWLIGLFFHLVVGGLFGVLYGYLFERVLAHGGASTGWLVSIAHAAIIGMFIGLTPQFHPLVPQALLEPGAYFSRFGTLAVLAFFGLHMLFGIIVGTGYGHVASERQWAPGSQHLHAR
jgi:hypothetical protein